MPRTDTPRFVTLAYPLGRLFGICRNRAIVRLGQVDTAQDVQREAERAGATEDPSAPLLASLAHQLDDYFSGNRMTFDLPLDPPGTTFRRRVWQELLTIPYGETRTYGEIANAIGDPGATQAVGQANHHNPIGILIPCHRVIGADGSMVGYASGVERKKWLLRLEGAEVMRQRELF
ncbi:MAG: methylated-DNA--[protein]-cysteine S-methyltransferase [Acidobacteriota bacterium]